MRRFSRLALMACSAICFSAACAGSGIAGETSVPDPALAWQHRDLSPVQAWLESDLHESADRTAVLRARAWLARRKGEQKLALELIGDAIELAPDRPDLRVDRAAFRSDEIDEAGPFRSLRIARDVRSDLEHAVAVAPENADALAALSAFHLRAPGIAGGDEKKAATLMMRLGELAPARLEFREALQSAEEERFEEALSGIVQAIAQAERPPPLWLVQMGNWLRQRESYERALLAYRQALSEAPIYTPALFELGRVAAESGLQADGGIEALRRFIELPRWPKDPETSRAWWYLGRIYARIGCDEEAASAYRSALALDPGWRQPRQSLEALSSDRNPVIASCGEDRSQAAGQVE